MRKFEILEIIPDPSGPGPDRHWVIRYKAIQKKKWVESQLGVMARNEKQAREKANSRFGDKVIDK